MTNPLARRQFLKLTSGTAMAGLFSSRGYGAEDAALLYQQVIPASKGLDAAWALSLVKRGSPRDAAIATSDKSALPKIGMTVGGIACGTVYLSGDGRLYVWDIFHQPHEGVVPNHTSVPEGMQNIGDSGKKVRERDGANYLVPPTADNQANPFKQGFVLNVEGAAPRAMDGSGWAKTRFTGKWPLGVVEYEDAACPLAVKLEAWTPFIPLSTADSSLPVTVMEYTLENRSSKSVKGDLTGIWENPVWALTKRKKKLPLSSKTVKENGHAMLLHGAGASDDKQALEAGDFGTAALVLLNDADAMVVEANDRISARFEIPAGGKMTIRFLLAWHFPKMRKLPGIGQQVPHFAKRFADAAAVVRDVAGRFDKLRAKTMRWVETWNDSTLPQWLLDRAILTTNTLQTTNCYLLGNNRFWAWEGVGCCPGTCAHVWHYAQGVARLFPDLERNLREVTDYGVAMNKDGSIRFRAEAANTIATDSQTGIVLRTWREHLVSADDGFLKRVWPAAKRALEWLIRFDKDGRGGLDGLLDGMQHNTLDAEWYGKVHCLCSLYLASLRAGQEMATRAGEKDFATECAKVHAMGAKQIDTLFNGEFYIQEEDPAHLKAIGVGQGCYIDQVIGQWWAAQVGLGRIYDAAKIRAALHALWKYNFVPEVGAFRKAFTKGRFYAVPGEAGLVMCTWPKGGLRDDFKNHWQYAYFNECMSGFEWQAAAHMVQEGAAIRTRDLEQTAGLLEKTADPRSLTARGLAISRAIHDRYAPEKRNPYNEIECSDHYARANASYSVFLAACGFEYDGPAGVLGFAPKIGPEDFRAPFTAAEGWGTFTQEESADGKWSATLNLAHGKLTLHEIRLPWLTAKAVVKLGDVVIAAEAKDGVIRFSKAIELVEGGAVLEIK
jgi:non-lysosomal glucosylceramidase